MEQENGNPKKCSHKRKNSDDGNENQQKKLRVAAWASIENFPGRSSPDVEEINVINDKKIDCETIVISSDSEDSQDGEIVEPVDGVLLQPGNYLTVGFMLEPGDTLITNDTVILATDDNDNLIANIILNPEDFIANDTVVLEAGENLEQPNDLGIQNGNDGNNLREYFPDIGEEDFVSRSRTLFKNSKDLLSELSNSHERLNNNPDIDETGWNSKLVIMKGVTPADAA